MSFVSTIPLSKLKKKYNLKVAVETGSEHGQGVYAFIGSRFEKIYSCEVNLDNYQRCLDRFSKNKEVQLFHAKSIEALPYILSILKNESALFWLDAHSFVRDTPQRVKDCFPLEEELKLICNQRERDCSGDVIIIDDICFLTEGLRPGHQEIERFILDPENIIQPWGIMTMFLKHEAYIDMRMQGIMVIYPYGKGNFFDD